MPLLSSKLHPPLAHAATLQRRDLLKSLDMLPKLTLISASAGFGKTTLLSEWVASTAYHVAYVSLDEKDNDPTRFWIYVIAALRKGIATNCDNSLGASSLELLQAPRQVDLELALTFLTNELRESEGEVVLVLEDYHIITSEHIHNSLHFLLNHGPERLHLMLIGRVDPPFPLARLRARGELREIREADLRFSQEEAEQYFTRMMSLSLSLEEITTLQQRTEGWIAGMHLAALSLQRHSEPARFVRSFTGSHRFVLDYLIDEVLQQQPESMQRFLLHSSILPRFNADLCAAVCEIDDCRPLLAQLEANHLFLFPLDEEREWYRYHALFADALLARLRALSPELVAPLHARASRWFEREDFSLHAVPHALQSRDYDYARKLIEKYMDNYWFQGELSTVLSWCEALPSTIIARSPRLLLSYALVLCLSMRANEALSWLGQLEQVPDSGISDQELHGRVATIRSLLASRSKQPEMTIDYAQEALRALPDDDFRWRLNPTILLGLAYQLQGKVALAEQAFREATYQEESAYFMLVAQNGYAHALDLHGKSRQALALHRSIIARIEERRIQLPQAGYTYLGLAYALLDTEEEEQADVYFTQSLEWGRRWGSSDLQLYSCLGLIECLLTRRDWDGAQERLEEARQLLRNHNELDVRIVNTYQVLLWLRQKEYKRAFVWAHDRVFELENVDYEHSFEYFLLATILVEEQRYAEALSILDALLLEARQAQRIRSVIEILTLQARICAATNEMEKALDALEAALSLTASEGLPGYYLKQGQPLCDLLQIFVARRERQALPLTINHARKLLASFGSAPSSPPLAAPVRQQALIEPLSDREREVLGLLMRGDSNQQIAEALVVSLSTVKKHVGNILDKLSVSSRTQAILRARELGLG